MKYLIIINKEVLLLMYKEKTCRVCGQIFIPNSSRQNDCLKEIVKICSVCGKEFKAKCSRNDNRTTCSTECTQKLASANRQLSYMTRTRICALCGEEFHPRSNTQMVCDKPVHTRKCIVCGKEFVLDYDPAKGRNDLRKTCSNECLSKYYSENNGFRTSEAKEKYRQTMLSRYGVEHPSQNADSRAKQKATTKERYGVEFFTQSKQYRQVAEATNMKKYGVAWPMQNESILRKRDQTNLDRFGYTNPMYNKEVVAKLMAGYKERTGYDYPMHNPEVQAKSRETCKEKYGVESYSQTDEYKQKVRETSLERYGTEYPMQNAEIRNKAKQTCIEKYGVENYMQSEGAQARLSAKMKALYGKDRYSQLAEWKLQVMKECTNIDEWMKFTEDPKTYILEHYDHRPKYRELGKDLGVNPSAVSDVICRHGLKDMISRTSSYMEEDIVDLLEELNIKYILHDRMHIYPYELDIYVPEYNFAIECNPTGTHNSSIPFIDSDAEVTPIGYHKMKTDLCEKQGISLFHLFGYDWTSNKDIIISMIKNRLHRCNTIIYARRCKVVSVSGQDAIQFLNANHRQGNVNSPIRIGLEHEGNLVSIMTFSKVRNTIGSGSEDLSNCWELVRFCSLINTSVVGGASKLFKYFVDTYHPQRIRSFSDRARTAGTLYLKLGFEKLRNTDPGYMWVDIKTNKAYSRVNAQKQNIRKFLNDENIDLSKTEKEIMIEHGYVQVFDSGAVVWEWCCK